ncbi:16S rRNA (uracil(1498)-N(3))-methyltransferase [Cutibacterium equinum]|uniref:Ribosomal RNA small subunit methyltransferase E n=1 Tax=Cutibacterium equinum TaxID=3016342 RepID=A0ABY7R1I0_9ACTN|nr:16S rRNA (uracil(1498)-N(3))-methyltransferase [Cutibacterium equinum]WCC80674.1 16S rRNA (uracil(1498)-N(3))-methyltransferase [Cutibacterium equinum]
MSDPCFLGEVAGATPGTVVDITGAEGHHASSVRRIRVGESVLVTDGQGHAVRGPAIEVTKGSVRVEVVEVLEAPVTAHRWVGVQALPKSDRAELAVATLTEMGVHEILAWQADRSIVRWKGDKQAKGVAKWQAAAREATKQSRRFLVPPVALAQTEDVVDRIRGAAAAYVFHESATEPLVRQNLPESGEVMFIVGPEGGITDQEVEAFVAAGAHPVTICDAVLRTSTAGVVGLTQLRAMADHAG